MSSITPISPLKMVWGVGVSFKLYTYLCEGWCRPFLLICLWIPKYCPIKDLASKVSHWCVSSWGEKMTFFSRFLPPWSRLCPNLHICLDCASFLWFIWFSLNCQVPTRGISMFNNGFSGVGNSFHSLEMRTQHSSCSVCFSCSCFEGKITTAVLKYN